MVYPQSAGTVKSGERKRERENERCEKGEEVNAK